MFELATAEEIDKLGRTRASSDEGRFTDEIFLGDVSTFYADRQDFLLPVRPGRGQDVAHQRADDLHA